MEEKNIIDILQEEFIGYASEILVNNLPSIDGLLPVNRKVIHALNENHITSDKPFIKMLRASSMAMVYYVFGDLPLTGAMKNMGNNSINHFYLEPKGSWGDKQRKEGVGASPRYIECKLSKYSESMLEGIKKNNVPMKRNFDNTEDEPIILPSIIPNILTNTSQSIAVGESSKIPSHNLIEVCDSFISYIKTNNIDISISLLKGADFSLGGKIIYDKDTFEQIYKTGRGSFTLTGKYIYDKKDNMISIIEVPYETYIEDIEAKLRACYEKDMFKEIVDIHDGTDKDGIRLDIYLKKNTDIDQFIAKLRKYTPYESKFACNFTVLDLDGKTPVLMSLEDIIQRWVQHRINCIKSETMYDISKNKEELNRLYGLKIINDDLDMAIKLIRSSKSEKIAIEKLISHFKLNQAQAEYVATIRLVNINQDWITSKIDNINKLEKENDKLEKYYNSEKGIKITIVSQLETIKKKFGVPRKTELIEEDKTETIAITEEIPDYNVMFYTTKEGYIKKIPLTSLRSAGEHRLKDGDTIVQEINSTNLAEILVFTDKAVCYKLRAYELADSKTSVLGDYLPSLLSLDKDESIVNIVITNDFQGNMLFAFENGKIAKVTLDGYKTLTKRTKVINAYATESPLVNSIFITEDVDLVCMSDISKVLIFNTKDINAKTTKSSMGVMVLKSKNGSFMTFCELLSNVQGISDIEYYSGSTNSIGTFQKRTDKIEKIK